MKQTRIVLILLLFLLMIAPALASDTYMGYVVSRTMNTVMVFDPNSNSMVTSFSADNFPQDIVLNPGGTYAYVVNLYSGTLTIYDTTNYINTAKVTFTGFLPNNIVANEAGDTLYVSSYASIYIVDAATKTVTGTISVPGKTPRQMTRYGTKIYAVLYEDDQVAVIDTTTNTVTKYINVGDEPRGITCNTVAAKVYVTNEGSGNVKVIDPTTDTVTATINVGSAPYYPCISSNGATLYVPNAAGNTVSVINTATNTVTATINVGSQPYSVALEPNNQRLYVANNGSNNISVVNTASNTITSSINCTYNGPYYMIISKLSTEFPSNTPIQVTFTINSNSIIVKDANVSVYDSTTGSFINSDMSDDAGNVIFWLIPGKRYTVQVTGSDIVTSTQSVQVQPNREQYTINVDLNFNIWNPFDWFNTNGTSTNGSRDSTKSITGAFAYTSIGTTGYMEAKYNDTTGKTTKIVFTLYKYNTTTLQYQQVNYNIVNAANGSYNFTILNAENNTYRVVANGTNYLFSQGNITRMGEHYFRPQYSFNMGWPAYLYNFFDVLIIVMIGLTSTKRHSIAGAVFMLFISWIFVLIGWTSNMGVPALIIPLMLSVFTIIIFVYAAAKWRRETGV